MACCGSGPVVPLTSRHRIRIRYLGGPPVRIVGPVTGVVYRFSASDRVQLIEPRDAVAISRSRALRIEGVVRHPESPS